MQDQEQFAAFARAGLAAFGIAVDETDLAVMYFAEQVYGPERDALLAADLSGVPPEHGLDPSRSPDDQAPGS